MEPEVKSSFLWFQTPHYNFQRLQIDRRCVHVFFFFNLECFSCFHKSSKPQCLNIIIRFHKNYFVVYHEKDGVSDNNPISWPDNDQLEVGSDCHLCAGHVSPHLGCFIYPCYLQGFFKYFIPGCLVLIFIIFIIIIILYIYFQNKNLIIKIGRY